jgi:hypothetical protein
MEERGLRVFETRVLRGIHTAAVIKSRIVRWTGHVARMGGEYEGQKPLQRPNRIWEDNIEMDFQ